jgi:hypothetical protein
MMMMRIAMMRIMSDGSKKKKQNRVDSVDTTKIPHTSPHLQYTRRPKNRLTKSV